MLNPQVHCEGGGQMELCPTPPIFLKLNPYDNEETSTTILESERVERFILCINVGNIPSSSLIGLLHRGTVSNMLSVKAFRDPLLHRMSYKSLFGLFIDAL
jgi:hypothetical protein